MNTSTTHCSANEKCLKITRDEFISAVKKQLKEGDILISQQQNNYSKKSMHYSGIYWKEQWINWSVKAYKLLHPTQIPKFNSTGEVDKLMQQMFKELNDII